MRATFVAVCLALVGCERIESDPQGPPLQPFGELDWSKSLTDDELVRGMVGTGGTAAERAEVERMARELLVPLLRAADADDLASEYRRCEDEFRSSSASHPVTAFAIVAATERSWMLHWDAQRLAEARGHHELWPSEPIDDQHVAAIDPSTIDERARRLRADLARLRTLVYARIPEVFAARPVNARHDGTNAQRMIWMIEDNLRIASGGGYARSNNRLYQALVKHGIPTTYTPGAR
jgi:hypothetical protein